jgi:hypothetical protein
MIKPVKMAHMTSQAEDLFRHLDTADKIRSLIGQSESLFLDCKEWPAKDTDAQHTFAKAACGMANAEGGVLVVGMIARSSAKDEPDLVSSVKPVSNIRAVKSRILDLVGQLVEPTITGIEANDICETPSAQSGFVTVYIPASGGNPRRSRKDWKFYLRIGSGTYPMEYFQIVDRFGLRPAPMLAVSLDPEPIPDTFYQNQPARSFWLGLTNNGRGIAKFPSVRFERSLGLIPDRNGVDGMRGFGLPLRPSEAGWVVFRGGVDDVIYPGEQRLITKLQQFGENQSPRKPLSSGSPLPAGPYASPWRFRTITFKCEIYAEGVPMAVEAKAISELIETVTVV